MPINIYHCALSKERKTVTGMVSSKTYIWHGHKSRLGDGCSWAQEGPISGMASAKTYCMDYFILLFCSEVMKNLEDTKAALNIN